MDWRDTVGSTYARPRTQILLGKWATSDEVYAWPLITHGGEPAISLCSAVDPSVADAVDQGINDNRAPEKLLGEYDFSMCDGSDDDLQSETELALSDVGESS